MIFGTSSSCILVVRRCTVSILFTFLFPRHTNTRVNSYVRSFLSEFQGPLSHSLFHVYSILASIIIHSFFNFATLSSLSLSRWSRYSLIVCNILELSKLQALTLFAKTSKRHIQEPSWPCGSDLGLTASDNEVIHVILFFSFLYSFSLLSFVCSIWRMLIFQYKMVTS